MWQFFNVKLIDAFLGICGLLFPQYLTKAILLGVCQLKLAFSTVFVADFEINCAVFKSLNFVSKIKLFQ